MASFDPQRDQFNRGWNIFTFEVLRNPSELLVSLVVFVSFIAFVALVYFSAVLITRVLVAAHSGTTEDINKLLLALAGLIGAPFLAWRTIIAAQNTTIARETHYTTLFSKSIEQLGATKEVKTAAAGSAEVLSRTEPNLEVRLGAIYALERIAHDSKRDYWPIIETLCAYVRENTEDALAPVAHEKHAAWEARLPDIRVDVQAALTVLGRRPVERLAYEYEQARKADREEDAFRLDLRGANLQKADLSHGAFGRAIFDDCSIQAAKIDSTQFHRASFHNAKLSGIFFDSEFPKCVFKGAQFSQATFIACDLAEASFTSAKFHEAQMAHVYLKNADFIDAAGSLSFQLSDLSEANFTGARMRKWRFEQCTLTSAKFTDAEIDGSYPDILGRTEFREVDGFTDEQRVSAKADFV